MELPLRLVRPFLGARIIKTGLAVFLTLLAFHLIGSEYATFAGVAAILAVQPAVSQAKDLFLQQLLGNLVGGAVAALLGLWVGTSPFTMAIGVVVVLGLLNLLRLTDAASLAVVSLIFIMDRPHHDFLYYTGIRIGAVVAGMGIGYLVNRYIHPPDFLPRLREELQAAGQDVDTFTLHLIDSLAEPDRFEKGQIKGEAAAVQRRLDIVRSFLSLTSDRRISEAERLRLAKAINSLFVFTERIMDIHKLILGTGGLGRTPARGAVAQALENVIQFRQDVVGAALTGGRPSPSGAATFAEGLQDLESLIARLIEDPASRELGLVLYAVLTNIRHMGWRMESLARLL